jgi:hypothetical protein
MSTGKPVTNQKEEKHAKAANIKICSRKSKKDSLENLGIDPSASRMLSERSTI